MSTITATRSLLVPTAIKVPPSERPAAELPEIEPTIADLLAMESWSEQEIDEWMAAANTMAAEIRHHRDLLALRAELDIDVEAELAIAAAEEFALAELESAA